MAVVPSWIEAHCVVPDGFRKGEPFALYDYQLEYFANFYLVRGTVGFDPVNPVLGPAFVYRRGLLVGPQKLGKGPHTAAHVCVEGVGPALFAGWAGADDGYACREHGCRCAWEYPYDEGEPMGMPWPTPLVQITAFSEEQTDNIYDALRPMIEEGPLADLIPKTGEEFIRLPGGGRVDTVTSSAQSRLGQRVTFVPQDEVGIWTKHNKMVKVADTQYRGLAGMGGRASLTTNAWDRSENSVAQREFESGAKDVYRQFVQPPRSLSYADRRDRRRIHRIVYPKDTWRRNGGHVDLDAIEAEAADLAAKDPQQAARFFGNVVTTGAGLAVDAEQWAALARPKRRIAPDEPIGVGFDGSISDDQTWLVGCTADGHLFVIRHWRRPEGATGWRVPRAEVKAVFDEVMATRRVGRVLCDPFKWWSEVEEWAAAHGDELVMEFPTNSATRFAPACDRFSTAVGEGDLTHEGHPELDEHVFAMARKYVRVNVDETDLRNPFVFVKADTRKIDGGVAATLAYEAAMTMPEPEEDPDPFIYVFPADA